MKYNGFNNGKNALDGVGGKPGLSAAMAVQKPKKIITVAAIDTLKAVCISAKVPFTIRFNHWDKSFAVKVMGKQFTKVDLDKALTEAIRFVSLAHGYITEKDWPISQAQPQPQSSQEQPQEAAD